MPPVFKILFFCRHNSLRAPLAAAIAERQAAPKVEAFCAGLTPAPITPEVEKIIFDLTGEPAKTVADLSALADEGVALVVVLGDRSHESPAAEVNLAEQFPQAEIVEWDMPGPSEKHDINHVEIELAERLILLFSARHLI
ncbi:hypothetical protein ACQUQP_13035 [Marinobacterium sp. YM272]|uniref:hypothetical protein n=1 Tax=Marinobacterium sp. YM272 TaxID=3421654 RepID=UPI003D7FAE7E